MKGSDYLARKASSNYNMTKQEAIMIEKSENAQLSNNLYIQKSKKGPSQEVEER
jgi:hypothetical protein